MTAPSQILLLASLAQTQLITVAEKSGWTETGRYEEVVRLCSAFEKKYRGKVRCRKFGTTPEGRPMLALVAGDAALQPDTARKKGRPVLFLQGGIHAGEIDGKDAVFWLLRDVLEGKTLPNSLSKVTIVFIPVFNVDGHERFGANNRPNQIGPKEMGWRVTAQNLNLNRDYTKVDAPEMAAMLRLFNEWDPILHVDLHVTDGSDFEHDVSVGIEPLHAGPENLQKVGAGMRDALFRRLESQQHLPLDFYPSFVKEDDPASGFAIGIAPPRFGTGYWPTRNRLAVLVETHSWKNYATRVRATRDVCEGLIDLASTEGNSWLRAAREADSADESRGGSEVALAWEPTGKSVPIKFRGYAYTREPSDVSGGLWTRYDVHKPQIWNVPLLNELRPAVVVKLPKGGYIVPAGEAAWVGEKLRLHGIAFEVLKSPQTALEVEAFRATEVKLKPETFEGHALPLIKGAWASEKRDVPANSLYVPASQRGALLIAHLFEPTGPDSFLSWGLFNAFFEQKESMENYVAEGAAREMLKKNPKLKSELDKRLAEDPSFAKDPSARLKFFARRHPTWDDQFNLYPVYRVQSAPGRR